MGYYENPPMLNLSKGTERITAGVMDAANSFSNALIRRGDIKREEERQRQQSIQKIQDEKNRVDLFYADKLSDWEVKNLGGNDDINSQAKVMLQEKIKLAADARIALTMETDPAKRSEYLAHITNVNKFMEVAAKASKGFSMEASTYSDVNAISMNVAGGWAVTGDGEVRRDRTSALDIMSKRTADFENSGMKLIDRGDSFDVEFYGKRKADGSEFKTNISALDYVNSDENGNGGLLQKIANADEFFTDARKAIYDSKSNDIYSDMVDPEMQTVDIGNGYQLTKASRLNLDRATEKIREKAEIKAAGYMKVNKPSDMWGLVNWTLGMGEGYYEQKFLRAEDGSLLSPKDQEARLTDLLTEKAITNMFGTHKTTNNGKDIWLSGTPVQVKAGKVTNGTGGKQTSGGGSGNTGGELTKTQKTLNAKILNGIQNGVPVTARGLTMRKDKAGNWEVVTTNDGLNVDGTEGNHNPWELQGYLGGSLSEAKNKTKKLPIIKNKTK